MTKIITMEKDEVIKDESDYIEFSEPELVPLQTVKINTNRSKDRTHIIIRPRSNKDIMADIRLSHELNCDNSYVFDEDNLPDSIDECSAKVLYNRCFICNEKEVAIKLAAAKKESETNGNNK